MQLFKCIAFNTIITRVPRISSFAFGSKLSITNYKTRSVHQQRINSLFSSTLPDLERVSSDSFMKQVNYSFEIVPFLSKSNWDTARAEDKDLVCELLKAQLSHSDGIRGFFVSYLTGDGTMAADEEDVPFPLVEAMNSADEKELVSLACMNVIMPTAMSTMHTDPTLSESSAKTAKRGKKVLCSLKDRQETKNQIESILSAASAVKHKLESDSANVKYWITFFEKYGYEEQQIEDIERVFSSID